MFGISGTEFIVIFVVALLVVGPKQLPDVMRFCGRVYRHLNRAWRRYRDIVDDALYDADRLAEKAERALYLENGKADGDKRTPPRVEETFVSPYGPDAPEALRRNDMPETPAEESSAALKENRPPVPPEGGSR
ncbi:MAG: twin-arginine translocase TatA/TatE family subunit [Alphaproteobacteria bacterium]